MYMRLHEIELINGAFLVLQAITASELLGPLGTPLARLALFLAADRVKRSTGVACSKLLKGGETALRSVRHQLRPLFFPRDFVMLSVSLPGF